MSKSIGKSLKNNRKGNMPFALVAVAILLIASSYCIINSLVDDQESESENIQSDISALGAAPEAATSYINTGLGKIIYDVCTNDDFGNLDSRCTEFKERADAWLSFQFPLENSGVVMKLGTYSIELQTEKMSLGDTTLGTEGYVPSYLKAVGNVTVTFVSESGNLTRTLGVSTDGSCALPLTLEMGSMFENAVTGGGSMLSQMVNYQLTSLAQYRVINGYGSLSQYGPKGTDSIITEADVVNAYRNAMNALECMFFRDSSGKSYFGTSDIAKDFVSNNGLMSVDLNSVYAQALSGHVDNLVGKWFDYLLGNVVVDIVDYISDKLKDLWDSFVSLVTGKNEFSAKPYIKEVVGDADLSVCSGKTFTYYVEYSTGEKVGYEIEYPDVDIYDSKVIKKFKSYYRANTNSIKEWIYTVVNGAVYNIANSKNLGMVTLDISDSETFADALADAINETAMNNMVSFESVVKTSLKSHELPDQFYSAIYATIDANKDKLFCYSEESFLQNSIEQVSKQISKGLSFSELAQLSQDKELQRDIQNSVLLSENRDVAKAYQLEVGKTMDILSALNNVRGENKDVAKMISTAFLECGVLAIDCRSDIKKIALAMCEEYKTNISVNPMSGLIEFPEENSFTLTGDNQYTEKISIEDYSNPSVSIKKYSSKSSHEVGFSESSDASYCTVIGVSLKDRFTFTASSSGSLLALLGLSDSVFTDTVEINMNTDITVVSGNPLVGVDYKSSTNIYQDVYNLLLKALEPLLKPLRDLMHMAQDVMNKISQTIMQINQYLTELMEQLYNAIMAPLEKFFDLVFKQFTEAFCDALAKVIEGAEPIVDVNAVSQKIGFTYMGYALTFTFHLPTLEKYTKSIVKVEFSGDVSGNEISAFLNIKTKGDGDKKTPCITGGFSIVGDKWDLSGTIDPTMTTNKNFMTLNGTVKGIKIDAVLPQAVQYNEIGIRLSDMPGIGTILSNIPSPIAGTEIAIDAGISLKYNLPIINGVLINEFESNPAGTDSGNEWAEILNASGITVDLSGWTLTTSKNKVHNIKECTLAPGERVVINFEGSFLNNSKERLILKDPDGVIVDTSATMSDNGNDERTCQRATDASTEWSLLKGTPGEKNLSSILGENGALTSVMKDIVKKAAVKAIDEVGNATTPEELGELFVKFVYYAIDDSISRISNCLVEGSVFLSVEFADVSKTSRTGFEAYIMVDGTLVEDVLKYLLGKAQALFLNVDDPYNIDIDSVLYDDVYLGVGVYVGIKAPSFLCNKTTTEEKVLMEIDIACNLSAIGSLLHSDLGTPKVKAQIGIKNCPYSMIPKTLSVKKNMSYDLWFIRATFSPA